MRKTNQFKIYTRSYLLTSILTLFNWLVYAQCQLIIDQDFNHWDNRRYTVADAKSDFNNKVKPWTASTYRGLVAPGAASNLIGDVAQETRIVNGELRAEYKKNDAGGYAGGFLFDPYFDGVEEAYLEYKVKFDANFFWASGGKLPGLGGSIRGVNSETEGRGAIPSGGVYDESGSGFSARLMWRRNRAQTDDPYFILYSYFAEKPDGSARKDGEAGDAIRLYTGLDDNKWYTVRQYIKLNTPGQDNGTVVMWIDGVEVYRNTRHNIRQAGKGDLKINALIMNTYRGGSRTDAVWHSPRDEYAFFDDFKVWTGCSEPPSDNRAPTGLFVEPMINTIEEGYSSLYVKVDASDPDGDALKVTLKIDGIDVRGSAEQSAPYEWGHANTPKPSETLGLLPGDHVLQAIIEDSKGAIFTVEKIIKVTIKRGPFSGVPINLPGTIQAEAFDKGELGISYYDTDLENKGASRSNFRVSDGVDIDNGNGGYVVGWTSTGEWLEYTVEVAEATTYDFEFHVSSLNGGGLIGLDVDGDNLFSSLSVPKTDDWNIFQIITKSAYLSAGTHVLRINIENNGFNLDKIEVKESAVTALESVDGIQAIQVYPNPSVDGVFKLSRKEPWKVLSIQGSLLFEGMGDQINLSEQNKGVYIAVIDNKSYRLIYH